MNITRLFNLQQELDERIKKEHGLENESLFERKVLALLVELGELANETRCFKYWSKKPSSDTKIILEEYVDGVHFILSLGIELNVHEELTDIETSSSDQDIVSLFMEVYRLTLALKENPTKEWYVKLISAYFQLGQALSFSIIDMEEAYLKKNLINHERQNTGY
ncbi:dimeric dUTPase (all-alpha-NTP-PPase superfamily) [Bacillus mesophilus]|uniref:dUTPase n=1 Tax=Bacillus mesophilus TaxID=1808955 RepID=A0A6M0Q9X2_9BACI|nr:dUTP diphosphatase [Bacillus mesophilus]MBM7660594.1 dimeric dUTPase (all-alpha-NTP-PPase superfamily) [Bacillus mesophilus]NEY71858.1 dUTPase [Bacillus mesophilus]